MSSQPYVGRETSDSILITNALFENMGEKPTCRSCGGDSLDDLGACASSSWRTAELGHHDPGRLLSCQTCGLAQRHPIPDEKILMEMYRQTPSEEWTYQYQENAAWALARQRLEARFNGRREVAVCDVGCHRGSFLSGLPMSWQKYGVESGSDPIRIAREQNGVTIIGDRIQSVGCDWEGRFDAVTMFDVVEHLTNPEEGIAKAARLLKPTGVLILSTGNFAAWTWRWLGGGHWYLQTPQHLSVISRRFLIHVADRHALQLIDTHAIPHRRAPLFERWHDAAEAVYWGMRRRQGIYRLPHRIMQSLPGLRHLRHMRSVPWTMKLTDHFLVTLEPR
jgi:2-polyprenyl-3-methyl-5-hydroxy-6-metoxy-1,4-benzoquinol methylase